MLPPRCCVINDPKPDTIPESLHPGRPTGTASTAAGTAKPNAALYRVVIVRMRFHHPTIDYVTRRSAEGLTKKDIIRCLKRFVAREAYHRVITDYRHRQPILDL